MAHTTNELASKTNILKVNQVNNNRPINIVTIKRKSHFNKSACQLRFNV